MSLGWGRRVEQPQQGPQRLTGHVEGRRRASPFARGMQQHAEPGRCGAAGPAGSLASRTGLIWGGRLSTGAGEMSWLTALLADMEQTGREGGGGREERMKKKKSTYKAVEHRAGDAAWQTHVHFQRRQLGWAHARSISFLGPFAAASSGS